MRDNSIGKGKKRILSLVMAVLVAIAMIPFVGSINVRATAGKLNIAVTVEDTITDCRITVDYDFYSDTSGSGDQRKGEDSGSLGLDCNSVHNDAREVTIPTGTQSLKIKATTAGKALDTENSYVKINDNSQGISDIESGQLYLVTPSDTVEVKIVVKNSTPPSGGEGQGGEGGNNPPPGGNYDITFNITGNTAVLGNINIDDGGIGFTPGSSSFTAHVNEKDSYEIKLIPQYPAYFTKATVDGVECTASGDDRIITVSKKDSYTIEVDGVEDLDEVNILWTYDPNEKDGGWADAYIDSSTGRVELVKIARDGTAVWNQGDGQDRYVYDSKHMVAINDKDGYVQCRKNDVVTLKFIPAAGYQLSSASLNGFALQAQEEQSTFIVTMSGLFHLQGAFTKASVQGSVSSSSVTSITANDTEKSLETGTMAIVAKGGQTNPSETAITTAMGDNSTGYISTVETVDIELFNIVSKGGSSSYAEDSSNYWATPKTSLSSDATVCLTVAASGLSDGQTYGVVREHGGNYDELSATYDSSTGELSFASSEFSNYTIIKKKGTPETKPSEDSSSSEEKKEEKKEEQKAESGDSGSTGTSSGTSTTPAVVTPKENNKVNVAGANYSSTISGSYQAWSVPGLAVIEPAATAKQEAGLAPAEFLHVTTWDITKKTAPLALASLQYAADTQKATLGPTLQLNVNKMVSGKLLPIGNNAITVRTVVQIPAAFFKNGAKYAVAYVKSGGAIETLQDLDNNANTITFNAHTGDGAYALIRYN